MFQTNTAFAYCINKGPHFSSITEQSLYFKELKFKRNLLSRKWVMKKISLLWGPVA